MKQTSIICLLQSKTLFKRQLYTENASDVRSHNMMEFQENLLTNPYIKKDTHTTTIFICSRLYKMQICCPNNEIRCACEISFKLY